MKHPARLHGCEKRTWNKRKPRAHVQMRIRTSWDEAEGVGANGPRVQSKPKTSTRIRYSHSEMSHDLLDPRAQILQSFSKYTR